NTPALVARFGVMPTMLSGATVVTAGLAGALVVTLFAVAGAGEWWLLLIVWLALGVGTALVSPPAARLLLAASDEHNRNFVYAAQFSLSHACFLIAYPIAGWLGAFSLVAVVAVLLLIAATATLLGVTVRRRAPRAQSVEA